MDFTKAIPVIISGIFSSAVVYPFVSLASLIQSVQSVINAVLIRGYQSSGITVIFINSSMVVCRTRGSISITTSPQRWIFPNTGGFSLSNAPRPRLP
jgi:hypothetical protein